MEPSPEPRETISRFEKLLATLVTNRVDFVVVGGLAGIFNGCPSPRFVRPHVRRCGVLHYGATDTGMSHTL